MTAPRRATYRDPAGELGITEGDLEPVDTVLPDYAPDTSDHGYFTLDRILGYVLASALGAIVALVAVAFIQAVQS